MAMRIVIALLISLAFSGYVLSEDKDASKRPRRSQKK